ncbi:MAG: hypothetical protein OXC95_12880 [Dehalococcoidia bacterium]|nr:hypothetical protein [Dehalococcoidia bacterium]
MLVVDKNIPGPVLDALRTWEAPIATAGDIGVPDRFGLALIERMHSCDSSPTILVTRNKRLPGRAYAARFHQRGLTVVLLRWKTFARSDMREMARTILEDGPKWEEIASRSPSVISVSPEGSRVCAWNDFPEFTAYGPAAVDAQWTAPGKHPIRIHSDGSYLPRTERSAGYAAIVLPPDEEADTEILVRCMRADNSHQAEYRVITRAVELVQDGLNRRRVHDVLAYTDYFHLEIAHSRYMARSARTQVMKTERAWRQFMEKHPGLNIEVRWQPYDRRNAYFDQCDYLSRTAARALCNAVLSSYGQSSGAELLVRADRRRCEEWLMLRTSLEVALRRARSVRISRRRAPN